MSLAAGDWQCHVCGAMRPDAAISVYSEEEAFQGSKALVKVNVRYCNDNRKCLEGAPHVARRWLDGPDGDSA